MKAFLSLSVLFLLSYFEATAAQEDADQRLEQFFNSALAGLPKWMRDHGYPSDEPLFGGDRFTLTSETLEGYKLFNFTGEIMDRVYYGVGENIRALRIKSNLSKESIEIDLAYGDGENASIQGRYTLNGLNRFSSPIKGNGTFTKTNILTKPFYKEESCHIFANSAGYFEMNSCSSYVNTAKFANLTLINLETPSDVMQITEIVNSWYDAQIQPTENVKITSRWFSYMSEVLRKTPIVDIIGTQLPATVTASEKTKSPTFTRKIYFNSEKNREMEQLSMNY